MDTTETEKEKKYPRQTHLTQSVFHALQALARKEKRSLSFMIAELVEEALKQRGELQ